MTKSFSLVILSTVFLASLFCTTALCQDVLQSESQPTFSAGRPAFKILTPTDNSVLSKAPSVIFVRIAGIEQEGEGKVRIGNISTDSEWIEGSLILEVKTQRDGEVESEPEKIEEDYGYEKNYNGYDLFRYELSLSAKVFEHNVEYTLIARQKGAPQMFAQSLSNFEISPDVFTEFIPMINFEAEKRTLSIRGESGNIAQLTIILDDKIILESLAPIVNHSFILEPGKHDVWLLATTDTNSYHQAKHEEFDNPTIPKPTILFIIFPKERIDVMHDEKSVYFTQDKSITSVEVKSVSEAVKLFLNGKAVQIEPERKGDMFIFSNISLQRGRNIVEAVAKYKYGTSDRSAPLSVVLDQMEPKIEIKQKDDVRLWTKDQINVVITDDEELNSFQSWLGETQVDVIIISQTESSVNAMFPLKNRRDLVEEGNEYVFKVKAVDKAGLESESSRTFTFQKAENEPPTITIISPSPDKPIRGSKVQIEAEIKDDVLLNQSNIKLTVDEKPEPFDYAEQILKRTPDRLSDGRHHIIIVATDADGKLDVASRYFNVDTTPPKVIGVNVPNSKTTVDEEYEWMTNSDKIRVEATVDDENCDVFVNKQAGNRDFTDKRKFLSELIHLMEGINNISITAKDSAGNQMSRAVKIYCDTQKPRLVQTEPDAKLKSYGKIPITVELLDTGVGIADESVKISLEPQEESVPIGKPHQEMVGGLLQVTQTYNLTESSDQQREYKINIEAEDKVANQLRTTTSFSVDTTIGDTDIPLIRPPVLKVGEKVLTTLNENEKKFINEGVFDISVSLKDYGSGLASASMTLQTEGTTLLERTLTKQTKPGDKAELKLEIPSPEDGVSEIKDGEYTIEIRAADKVLEPEPNRDIKKYSFIKYSQKPPLDAFSVKFADRKFPFETSDLTKYYIKSKDGLILAVNKKTLDEKRQPGQTFEIKINGNKCEDGFALESLGDGIFDNPIKLEIKDRAGNLTIGYLRLFLDDSNPKVEILQPRFEKDSLVADAAVIVARLSDEDSDIKDIRLYLDGEKTGNLINQYNIKSQIFLHELHFDKAGEHHIKLEVEDNAGRITPTEEKHITVVKKKPDIEKLLKNIDTRDIPNDDGKITSLKLIIKKPQTIETPAGYYIIHVPDSLIEISPIKGKSESISWNSKHGALFNWVSSEKQEILELRRKERGGRHISFEPGMIQLKIFEAEISHDDGTFIPKKESFWEEYIFIDNTPPNITFLNPPTEDFFITDNEAPLSLVVLKDLELSIVAKIEDEHSKVDTSTIKLEFKMQDDDWQTLVEPYDFANNVFSCKLPGLNEGELYKLKLTASDIRGKEGKQESGEFRVIVKPEKLSEKLKVEHLLEEKRIAEVGNNGYIEIKKINKKRKIDQMRVWGEGHKKAGGNYALLLKVNDIERSEKNRKKRGTILDLLRENYASLEFQDSEDDRGMGVEGDRACLLHWNLKGDSKKLRDEKKCPLSFSGDTHWEAIIGEEVKILIFKVKATENGKYELTHDTTFRFEYIKSEFHSESALLVKAPNPKELITDIRDKAQKPGASITFSRRYGGNKPLHKFLHGLLQFNLAVTDGGLYLSLAPGTRYSPANVHFGVEIYNFEDDVQTDDKEKFFVGISLDAEKIFDLGKWSRQLFTGGNGSDNASR